MKNKTVLPIASFPHCLFSRLHCVFYTLTSFMHFLAHWSLPSVCMTVCVDMQADVKRKGNTENSGLFVKSCQTDPWNAVLNYKWITFMLRISTHFYQSSPSFPQIVTSENISTKKKNLFPETNLPLLMISPNSIKINFSKCGLSLDAALFAVQLLRFNKNFG